MEAMIERIPYQMPIGWSNFRNDMRGTHKQVNFMKAINHNLEIDSYFNEEVYY